ncbi:unnamed protein product [Heligmosomoides polygyrus]|uniref:Methionine--tRNA ligase, mitochondrial n=1 Tax=Heligmosomoides polygyrus TaxID=6339 RepID=A0A183F820_HELPZ|nr:unnamed protein product [Heligmosomoides polygyrus]
MSLFPAWCGLLSRSDARMSKSLGNVVNPFDAAKSYSADGLRYFLLKQGVPHGDSNFSNEKAIHVINSDLVNNVGNLLSRATVKKLNPSQEYPKFSEAKDILEAAVPFLSGLKNIEASTEELYDELLFYKAIEGIMAVVKGGNGFFQLTQPWKLEPGPEVTRLSAVLYITYEAIRVASILLQPVIPTLADQALTRLVQY